MSIKKKLTIWYAVFLVVMAVTFVVVLANVSDRTSERAVKSTLVEVVLQADEKVDVSDGGISIDSSIDELSDDVYICVYDNNGKLVRGTAPSNFKDEIPLDENSLRVLEDSSGKKWYVYDNYDTQQGERFWIRGFMMEFKEVSGYTDMMKMILIAVPILILISLIGGYIISRRALRPVQKVTELAESISNDGDLSRRIDAGGRIINSQSAHSQTVSKDEIYRLAQAFNGMFDKLEENRMKEQQFTSDVSHELRTPLAVIVSESELAMEDEEYSHEALEKINREAHVISDLVSKLLLLSRSDAEYLDIEHEIVDLSQLCRAIFEQQTEEAEKMGITMISDIEDGIKVTGDETMLMRIVLNYLSNAFKYGKGSGGIVKMTLAEIGDHGGDVRMCRIGIEDDGPGIAADKLDKIWDRFYRVDESRSDQSTGLGLCIAEALAKVHGGGVGAESEPGRGSIFFVDLPILKEDL